MDLRTWSAGRLIGLTVGYWVVGAGACGWLVARWSAATAARYKAEHPEAVDFLTTVNPHLGPLTAIMLLPPLVFAVVWWWVRQGSRPAV